MASFNKVILMGNLTRDPQLTYLPSQTPVVEFGLAVNRRYRTQDGQQREDTCFIDCRMFGKRAEVINKYVRKGNPLMVEGRLDFDTWEAQDGSRRSKHRVFVENFEFMGSGGGDNRSGGGGGGGYGAPAQRSGQQSGGPSSGGGYDENYSQEPPEPYDQGPGGDDIPF
jgi:single-strand DNA-binding protein